MPKRSPSKRWRDDVDARYQRFSASAEPTALRKEGLRALGRRKRLTAEEWWEAAKGPMRSPAYRAFAHHCEEVGARYGLAQWTVEMACLLEGYSPGQQRHVMEAVWPSLLLVTEDADPVFHRWLLYEASRLGLDVAVRENGRDVKLIEIPFPQRPEIELTEDHRPPAETAFVIQIEMPPTYPPEAAAELQRRAQGAARRLLRQLGYPTPRRMRKSAAAPPASKLRLDKPRLAPRESGEIAEDVCGEGAALDPRLCRRIRDARYRLRKQQRTQ